MVIITYSPLEQLVDPQVVEVRDSVEESRHWQVRVTSLEDIPELVASTTAVVIDVLSVE